MRHNIYDLYPNLQGQGQGQGMNSNNTNNTPPRSSTGVGVPPHIVSTAQYLVNAQPGGQHQQYRPHPMLQQRQQQQTTRQDLQHHQQQQHHIHQQYLQQQQQQQPSQAPNRERQQPNQQRQQQQTSSQNHGLTVEDALLYLDKVRAEFGDGQACTDFLEIMKKFMAEELDTPGVIARVLSLFRGYNNLILGFNKFLPEDSKIELEDLVDNDENIVDHQPPAMDAAPQIAPTNMPQPVVQQQLPQAPTQHYQQPAIAVAQQAAPAGNTTTVSQPIVQQQLPQAPPQHYQQPAMDVVQQIAPHGNQTNISPPAVQQQHQLPQAPPQQHQQPTIDVVQQQLPQPIVVKSEFLEGQQPSSSVRYQQPMHAQVKMEITSMPGVTGTTVMINSPQQGTPLSSQRPMSSLDHPQQVMKSENEHLLQPPLKQDTAEFYHEISYVTTVKCRFSDDPTINQSFQEILHQKDQRSVNEVLKQVSSLFADHPDSLKQIKYFLPDSVQEQAKEVLHQAARWSEARQDNTQQQLLLQQQQVQNVTSLQGGVIPGQQQQLLVSTASTCLEQPAPFPLEVTSADWATQAPMLTQQHYLAPPSNSPVVKSEMHPGSGSEYRQEIGGSVIGGLPQHVGIGSLGPIPHDPSSQQPLSSPKDSSIASPSHVTNNSNIMH